MSEIECPYCEKSSEACMDDGNLTDPEELYQEECPHCEKHFVVSVDWHPVFTETKADCLNSGEHKPKTESISPEPEVKRVYCKDCGETLVKRAWGKIEEVKG